MSEITGSKKENEFFKLISGEEDLVLGATDGGGTLLDDFEMFPYLSANGCAGWDGMGPATPKALVQVYEATKDVDLVQVFGSLGVGPDLTPDQVTVFVGKYPQWLQKGTRPTLFLYRANNKLFIASVFVRADGCQLVPHNFEGSLLVKGGSRVVLLKPK